jgi:hypothetical protein
LSEEAPVFSSVSASFADFAMGQEETVRADETVIMDRHHHRDPGLFACGQSGGGNEGKEIVNMCNIRLVLLDEPSYFPTCQRIVDSAAECSQVAQEQTWDFLAAAGKGNDCVAVSLQETADISDNSFLSSEDSVFIMDEQDFQGSTSYQGQIHRHLPFGDCLAGSAATQIGKQK